MNLSTSKVKCYKACRRLYFFKYIEELRTKEDADVLKDGRSYHAMLEEMYSNNGQFEIDYTQPKVSAMATAYQKYIYPKFKVTRVEEWFNVPLTKTLNLVGIYDGIAEDGNLVEHKTTSSDVDEEYIYHLNWDEQILNYMYASGKNIVYYTICKKPTIRQKMNETEEQFYERCVQWYEEDTDKKIRVLQITRSNEEIAEQRKNLVSIGREMACNEGKKDKERVFYRNPSYCNQYGRRCEFESICLDYNPEVDYVNFERKGE